MFGVFADAKERHTLHHEGQGVIRLSDIDVFGRALEPEGQSPHRKAEGG